jgi:hypothetical protein
MDKKVFVNNLEKIALDALYGKGVNENMIKYTFEIFSRYIKKGSILELWPAEGIMTDLIYATGNPLTLVDGASIFCDNLRKNIRMLKFIILYLRNFL